MTDPTDLPPRDIPDDLVVFALIGGPWLAVSKAEHYCRKLAEAWECYE